MYRVLRKLPVHKRPLATKPATPGLCLALLERRSTYWADPLPHLHSPLHVKRAASSAKFFQERTSEGLAPPSGGTTQKEGTVESSPPPQWPPSLSQHEVCQLLLQLRVPCWTPPRQKSLSEKRRDDALHPDRTPVYEKQGPKRCIASPGGPRRVQTYPGLSSTTRVPFSPDTGTPRTARRGHVIRARLFWPSPPASLAREQSPPAPLGCCGCHAGPAEVKGFNVGYQHSKEKASLFRAPKDAVNFEKWDRAIPRADKRQCVNGTSIRDYYIATWGQNSRIRPKSIEEAVINQTLDFLDRWDRHAKGSGFLSKNTAEGLRVTLRSTKELLTYLTTKLGYHYIMTSRLSQDCIEWLFGIAWQASGPNDKPTPAHFCAIMSCLSYYSLAKSPVSGSIAPGMLDALLTPETVPLDEPAAYKQLDELIDVNDLDGAQHILDHLPYVAERSVGRLVYYIAGYVARKRVLDTCCRLCKADCLTERSNVAQHLPADATMEWDQGGLLYPSEKLYHLVLRLKGLPKVGCTDHCDCLTRSVVKFYCITRMHFFLKSKNRTEKTKSKEQKVKKKKV
ncbi:hypothetical protein HPB47_016929 [Ixodes persulcatus]|uniref:Uncharacterized protein n=1 Tax=Ixodes persulcatus TaxID=34615 RepID=A0AC60QPL5_IXOPE|nr:hypothetical protein HPB47_016929 [Ixodes persulcatus]